MKGPGVWQAPVRAFAFAVFRFCANRFFSEAAKLSVGTFEPQEKHIDFMENSVETAMAAQSANVIDFEAYRNARRPAATVAASPSQMPYQIGLQPMIMWVPVWTFFPMTAGAWYHAQ